MDSAEESERGSLGWDIQKLIGEKLRFEFSQRPDHFPEHLRILLRQFDDAKHYNPTPAAKPPADIPGVLKSTSHDPETVRVLAAAFDEAWESLQSIGNHSISRDELAKCLLKHLHPGDRNASRLGTMAIISLLLAHP